MWAGIKCRTLWNVARVWAVAWNAERCAMWNEVECAVAWNVERWAMWNEVVWAVAWNVERWAI